MYRDIESKFENIFLVWKSKMAMKFAFIKEEKKRIIWKHIIVTLNILSLAKAKAACSYFNILFKAFRFHKNLFF